MYRKYLIVLIIGVMSFSSCGEKDNMIDPETYRPIYEVLQAFAHLESDLIFYSEQGYGNKESLLKAAINLNAFDLVSNVMIHDTAYVYITMTNGLKVVYSLIPVDDEGTPLTRGGGQHSGGNMNILTGGCANYMENKKILEFNAHFSSGYYAGQILNENANKFDLEVTRLHNTECTYDVVKTFSDYGLVVLNTHGLPNGFQLGVDLPLSVKDHTLSLEEMAEQINLSNQDQMITDNILGNFQIGIIENKEYYPFSPIYEQLAFSDADDISTYLPAKQIATLDLTNTIVVGNMCYSGWSAPLEITNIPILTAFENTNVLTYYGWQQIAGRSQPVYNEPAQKAIEILYNGFFNEGENTGEAHLLDDGSEYHDFVYDDFPNPPIAGKNYFRQFLADDYCYQGPCPDSILDSRDDTWYKTICVGGRVWFAENLNYPAPGSECYEGNSENCETYGRLYDHATALTACPEGFRLPTESEWKALRDTFGGHDIAGGALKDTILWLSPNAGATNSSGWSGRPGGIYDAQYDITFESIGAIGMWWSGAINGDVADYFMLRYDNEQGAMITFNVWSRENKLSCRCIKQQ